MEPEEEPCGAAVREVYEEVSPSTEKMKKAHTATCPVAHHVATAKQPVKPSNVQSGVFACLITDCIHFPLLLLLVQNENQLSEIWSLLFFFFFLSGQNENTVA